MDVEEGNSDRRHGIHKMYHIAIIVMSSRNVGKMLLGNTFQRV